MDALTVILSIVASAITGVATAVGTFMTLRHKQRMESNQDQRTTDANAISQYQTLCDRLEKQNARWEEDSSKKQRLIEELVERDTLCQVRLARYWAWIQQANGRINWLAECAREAGHDVGEAMALPKAPPEYDEKPGFQARTSAQDTELLQATNPIPNPLQKGETP